MDINLNTIYYDKIYISCFILFITFLMFYITQNTSYIITAAIFISVNIFEYFIKKKRLQYLYNKYNNNDLNKIKYINFDI